VVNLGNSAVESDDIEAVISSVQDQILTHNGQADEAEISSGFIVSVRRAFAGIRDSARCPANIDGCKTSAGIDVNARSEEFLGTEAKGNRFIICLWKQQRCTAAASFLLSSAAMTMMAMVG
jgi:hypothetical protein